MSSYNLKIKKNITRPKKELLELFRDIPVANIADCMNRMSCLDSKIFPLNRAKLLGTAFTVKATNGDNLLFHKALDMAQPGDVIVVAGGGTITRSYAGEIMVRYAMMKGLAGFIVDGCMRDRDSIAEINEFPVYCIGVTPNGPYKNGPGEIGYPVSCAGQVICPGDILVGDGDGVVVIHPDEAEKLAAEARAVSIKEEKDIADIINRKYVKRDWIDAKINALGFIYED
ncbi:MAG: RraA family protein [Acetivibrionales bacterium]|jgi:regulator of RNase E activity RraA